MYVGRRNPNAMFPLEKMVIDNLDTREEITVLYNPQSYSQQKSVNLKSPTICLQVFSIHCRNTISRRNTLIHWNARTNTFTSSIHRLRAPSTKNGIMPNRY